MKGKIALKRAAKAKRRKAVVAEKRKAELIAASLPEQVRIAAGLPIQHCLLSHGFPKGGTGTLLLARGATPWRFNAGVFLLDSLCLGIKDIIFSSMTSEQLEDFREAIADTAPLEPVEPSYARKLLRDLASWAQVIGFAPARDFAVVERLFGDVQAEACDAAFQFGYEGKPLYLGDLSDTAWLKHSPKTEQSWLSRPARCVKANRFPTQDIRSSPAWCRSAAHRA
jgi:hypothetical protein